MSLKWLEARRFRNLTHISVDLDPGLNLLFGENGSGKTSLLESSYFLSTSRSFRDNAFDPVIQRGAEDCLLRGAGGGRRASYWYRSESRWYPSN